MAVLSGEAGRELGLDEPELTVPAYAALLRDIRRLSLVDPCRPGPPPGSRRPRQRRIAPLGGAVARQTGVDAEVAAVVERQADPYREQPVGARIVRAVNAYEEQVRETGFGGSLRALEELRPGTARDCHPEVVESLARVLSRDCLTLPEVG